MPRLRTAVIGAGRLGGFHAQKLAAHPEVELVAVADPVDAQRDRVASQHGVESVDDYRKLCGRIDAAVVAAPTRLHYPIAAELLARGVHLLVEKPVCPTADEADRLVQAARRAGVVLQVGHVERFNPVWIRALASVGEPRFLDAVRISPFPFRSTDVGVVLDVMIHDLDLVLSAARSPVRRLDAVGLSVLGGHEDVANVRIEFQSGCVAVLNASRVSYLTQRRMHLWSRGGFASADFAARKLTTVCPSEALAARQFDVETLTPEQLARKEEVLAEHLRREETSLDAVDALALETADFVASIRGGRAPRVAGEDGRDAVAMAEQILARIAAHAWDDHPSILPGPMSIEETPAPVEVRIGNTRKQAG
jgi:predicted dehydrogenase